MRRSLLALLGLALAGAAVLGAAVVLAGGGDVDSGEPRAVAKDVLTAHPVAGSFERDERTLADCGAVDGDRRLCVEQAFGNLVYAEGPKAALHRMAGMYASDPSIESNCHRIAHTIGSAALARYGDVGRAFANGDSTCWSGYYHGILERALSGAATRDALGARVRELCTEVLAEEPLFIAYQCVHGLGHGLMIRTGLDLPASLEICDRLADSWQQTSCHGGVFMENFNTSYGVRSRFIRDDDPLYPCHEIAERHKLYCYLQITDRILVVTGYDWQAAAGWCAKAEPDWRATCFQSYGRSASGVARLDQARLLELCSLPLARDRGDCVIGAAKDITSNDAGDTRARRFCAAVAPALRERCGKAVDEIVASF